MLRFCETHYGTLLIVSYISIIAGRGLSRQVKCTRKATLLKVITKEWAQDEGKKKTGSAFFEG